MGSLLLMCGDDDPYADYLVYDSFDDTEGVALASHVPEKGDGWVAASGAWDINTNQVAETIGAADYANAVIDSGDTDALITCNIKFPPVAGNVLNGIIVRYIDENNYIVVLLQGSTGNVLLYKKVAAGWTSLGSWAGGLSAGTIYAISMAVDSGHAYSIKVDGVERITATDNANSTGTKVGLTAYDLPDEATFDLFVAIAN